MTVPRKRTIRPADVIRAHEVARAQRIAERQASLKQAREWARERAKHAIPSTDPAYWYVEQRLREDGENDYRLSEPWCYKARVEIHLARWHQATQSEPRHVVYYIKVGKFIKIGTSRDVDKRLNQYPPGAKLLATEPGGYKREAERHEQFSQYLAERQEWFTPGPDLMAHVKNLQRLARDEVRAAQRSARPA